MCIGYALDSWPRDLESDFILKNSLFGGVKLSKNIDPDIYSCSGYGIGFYTRIGFSLPDGSVGKMLLFLELI